MVAGRNVQAETSVGAPGTINVLAPGSGLHKAISKDGVSLATLCSITDRHPRCHLIEKCARKSPPRLEWSAHGDANGIDTSTG